MSKLKDLSFYDGSISAYNEVSTVFHDKLCEILTLADESTAEEEKEYYLGIAKNIASLLSKNAELLSETITAREETSTTIKEIEEEEHRTLKRQRKE